MKRWCVLSLAALALLGTGETCDREDQVVFALRTTTASYTLRDAVEVQLFYEERDQFPARGNVCGFEIHWSYDFGSVSFPDCEGPDASHLCSYEPDSDEHPGILCACNGYQREGDGRGYMEVAAIVADAQTPLPIGPRLLTTFRVELTTEAEPKVYPLKLEAPGEEQKEVSYTLCSTTEPRQEGIGLLDGHLIILDQSGEIAPPPEEPPPAEEPGDAEPPPTEEPALEEEPSDGGEPPLLEDPPAEPPAEPTDPAPEDPAAADPDPAPEAPAPELG